MATALVTGASGFVGPHLLDHLISQGDEVIGVDRRGPGPDDRHRAHLRQGPDLLDFDGWQQLLCDIKPEVIYHLAGWSDVGGSWQAGREVWRVNTEGTMSILMGARAAGAQRVVLISSADVYGQVPAAEMPIRDDRVPNPASPYGASKAAAEVLARQFITGFDFDVVIARPFNHIGPGQSPNFVVPAFAFRIAEAERQGGGEVRHGDLSARRDFTDVRDTVRAYRLLAQHGHCGQTYNICTGQQIQIADMLERLRALARVTVTTSVDPSLLRPVEVPLHQGSAQRLIDHTGWAPTIDLSQTLSDVLDDARARLAAQSDPDHPTVIS